jgi:hypothetical protein
LKPPKSDRKDNLVCSMSTEKEFAAYHLANAKNVDARADTFSRAGEIDKSKTHLAVHSAGGGAATKP